MFKSGFSITARISWFLVFLLVLLGSKWAFDRGGNDFWVFYQAWTHVLTGQSDLIYKNSPDRYLYAPGFAWLLCPWGLLSKKIALAVWCVFKAGSLFAVLLFLGRRFFPQRKDLYGLAALGVLLVSRPLLIDFQYGQVNLLILSACVWAMSTRLREDAGFHGVFWPWFFLGIAAIAKLYALPLLLVPWFVRTSYRKQRWERLGMLAGVGLVLVIPLFGLGWTGTLEIYSGWKTAIFQKGLPLETHNQSVAALFFRFLTGEAAHVIAQARPMQFGWNLISYSSWELLAVAWTLITGGALLGWIIRGKGQDVERWMAISIAGLLVPLHLVWKPYLVMGIPLAALFVKKLHQDFTRENKVWRFSAFFGVLWAMNFTGFDFVGLSLGAVFEAASLMFLAHLALLVLCLI